jgi:hypothetical protein
MNLTPEVPEHTIVTPMEQWNNGYFVTVFEWRGLHWQPMQHGVHGPDALYTRLNYNMHYHLEWDGIISVEAAVQILDMLSKVHAAGVDHGRADMQKDIRKMIGMDK